MEGDVLVLPLGPVVQRAEEDHRRAGVPGELDELLVELDVSVLEHGRDDLLLEGRQRLSHLSVDVVVLLPQLLQRGGDVGSLRQTDEGGSHRGRGEQTFPVLRVESREAMREVEARGTKLLLLK